MPSKKQAVKHLLLRLGLHAKTDVVIEALARNGIRVSAELVQLVAIELRKDKPRLQRELSQVPQNQPRPARRLSRANPRHGRR